MEVIKGIDRELCTRCSKCVRVCPSQIFSREGDGPVELHKEHNCIVCGHCSAVCPAGAILHPEFPASKVHPIDYAQMPSPQSMMLLCKARRSMRVFAHKPVPEEHLQRILEAAHATPTASNSRNVSFTLITTEARLRSVSEFTLETFGRLLRLLENPLLKPILKAVMPANYRYVPVFRRMQRNYEAGYDGILRKAPALLLIHTPAASRFGAEDANLAYQNASLVAEALGVGQFYTGFVLNATRQRKGELEKMLGIDGRIYAGMALGMPLFRYLNYIDREEIKVNKL